MLSRSRTSLVLGIAFVVGATALFGLVYALGRLVGQPSPVDPGLEPMLARRRPMQAISAALLTVGSVILIGLIVLS